MTFDGVVACTGTPGCGKSSICESLGDYTTVKKLAKKFGCLGEIDEFGVQEIDIEMLNEKWAPLDLNLVDGHLSHHLPVDALIIVRCNPDVLAKRLFARGYADSKVKDNVEVELIGGPWIDLIDDDRPKLEVNSTKGDVSEKVRNWIAEGCPPTAYLDTSIDWLGILNFERNAL